VSDAGIRVAIGALRKALDDTARTPRFIAMMSRRGYSFLAPVEEHTGVAPVPVPVSAEPGLLAVPQLPETLARPEAERRRVVSTSCVPCCLLRSPRVSQVPEPRGDRPSVLGTRLLHLETRRHARSL